MAAGDTVMEDVDDGEPGQLVTDIVSSVPMSGISSADSDSDIGSQGKSKRVC